MRSLAVCLLLLAAISGQADSQIHVTFNGDTTNIWDANLDWWCGARFSHEFFIRDQSIRINECDTMPLTTCTCYFTLRTSIVGLSPGTYDALISRQLWVHHQGTSQTVSTGTITFTVPGGSGGPISTFHSQGPCSTVPSSVEGEENAPSASLAVSNYPNPFNPTTIVRYAVPRTGHVTLSIFDASGRQVAAVVDGIRNQGIHEVMVDASAFASGMYICRLIAGEQIQTAKMLVVK